MGRTPPHEEEPAEAQHITYIAQRERSVRMPERSQRLYHSDEHPEIPKIRRASRYVEGMSIPSASTTRLRNHASPHQQGDELAVEVPLTPPLDEAARKIVVTRRRHTRIYEPPRTHYKYKYTQRQILLRTLSRNRTLLLLGILIALLLILLPIAQSIINHQKTQPTPHTTLNRVATQSASIDPHKLIITPETTDHPMPAVFASAAYLLDADSGATLYAYNPFIHLPMLSTTKLMTALVAVEEAGNRLDQPIPINDTIARDLNTLSADSALMGIKPGETYTLRELLYGALLMSGNDACIAIADGVEGNLAKFVGKMNQRAQELGMLDTHYINPHGLLDTGHYSSAHDLAILGKHSLDNTIIHTISATKDYMLPQNDQHHEISMFNGNQFLWWYPGVDGGKPGWDGSKNFNQIISVVRNHHHLIGVTMNTVDWWTDMRDLMNWGYDNFDWISPREIDPRQHIPYDADWRYFAKDNKENTIPTTDQGRYYIYTGYSISGPILAYYDKNGGLQKFGYPRGIPVPESGTTVTQKFDQGTIRCNTSTQACEVI